MASEIDDLLARALGRLGGPGARIVGRWLPPNAGEEQREVPIAPDQLRPAVLALLAEAGTPLELADPSSAGGMSALVGSGTMRLNPAVVTIWVSTHERGGSRVRVRGVAKEGLIKQRGGEQVAREFAAAIERLASPGDGP